MADRRVRQATVFHGRGLGHAPHGPLRGVVGKRAHAAGQARESRDNAVDNLDDPLLVRGSHGMNPTERAQA